MRSEKLPRQLKKQEILKTLHRLCKNRALVQGNNGYLPEPENWPKTRELSDCCGESIYTTRAILLQLVEEGKVIKSPKSLLNSLRWYVKEESEH